MIRQAEWIDEFVTNESKAMLLKTVSDATIVDKNHLNGRVFASFLYAFGKQVAFHCQMANEFDWKSYYSLCFDIMWNLFPNWHMLDHSGVFCTRGKSEKLSVKAFARVSAQVACRNKLKRNAT